MTSLSYRLLLLLFINGVSCTDPLITLHPADTYVAENKPATLHCKAEGDPTPVITWYKDDVMLSNVQHESASKDKTSGSSNRVQLSGGSLFFLKVNRKSSQSAEFDMGSYHCNATNPTTNRSVASRTAFLRPAFLRNEFQEYPTSREVNEGDDIFLTCVPPRGVPEPKIKWKKNENILDVDGSDRYFMATSNDLRIVRSSVLDSAVYSCVAYNSAGERESAPAVVLVKGKSTTSQSVRMTRNVTVTEGRDATFTCPVAEPFQPSWRKSNGGIPENRSQLSGDSLRITNVRPSDEGVYICSLDSVSGVKEFKSILIVNTIPTVQVTPKELSVDKGRQAAVACHSTGTPPPNIFWNHEPTNTFVSSGSSSSRFRVTENGTLIIVSVESEDSGEYVCHAVSLVGTSSGRVRIAVKELEFRPPPVIVFGPQNQTLPIGDTATMLCQATGDPEPMVSWLKNDEPMHPNEPHVQIKEDKTLEIKLKKSDAGLYTCIAVSPAGETRSTAHLQVESLKNTLVIFRKSPGISTFPGPPSSPTASEIKHSSLKLSWTPHPDRGSSEIEGYTVEMFCLECPHKTWVQTTVDSSAPQSVIQNLSADSTYLFLVRSRNSHGTSAPSAFSMPIKTKGQKQTLQREDVYGLLMNQQLVQPLSAEATGSTTVKVEWGFVEEFKDVIEGFIVKHQDIDRSGPVISMRSEEGATSMILENLEKFTWYEINVHPFSQHIEGMPTPARIRTFEDLPQEPPQNVQASWHGNDSLLILWDHPSPDGRNGVLKGYKIYVINNETKATRTTQVDVTVESLMMNNVARQHVYSVRVSAFNKIGESPMSREAYVGQYVQPALVVQRPPSIVSESWFIVVVIVITGVVLWVALCVLSVYIFRRHKRRKKCVDATVMGAQSCPDIKSAHKQFPLLTSHSMDCQRTNPCCYDNHPPGDHESKTSHMRNESQGHTYQTLDGVPCTYPHTWNSSNQFAHAVPGCCNNVTYNQQLAPSFPSALSPAIQASSGCVPTADIPDPAAYMIRYPPSNATSAGAVSDKNSGASECRELYVGGGSSDGSRSGGSNCGSGCSEHAKHLAHVRQHNNKFNSNVSSAGSSIRSNTNDPNQPLLYTYGSSHGNYHHDDGNSSHGSSNKSSQILMRHKPMNSRPMNVNDSAYYDDVTESCSFYNTNVHQKLFKHCNTPVSMVTDTDDENSTALGAPSMDDCSTVSSMKSEEYYHLPPDARIQNAKCHVVPNPVIPGDHRFKNSTFAHDPRSNLIPHNHPTSVATPFRSSPSISQASTAKNAVM